MSLSRPTILNFSASSPTSKYKPLRLRGLAFTGYTRISDKQFLAFRNLPDFQEFEMLMASASFKERVRHDRAMRAKHVETLRDLFKISPEEEEEMHRKWDASRGMASNWTPPSTLDTQKPKPRVPQSQTFSVGEAVWCKGHAAVVCAAHEAGAQRTYDLAYIAAGGKVQLLKNEATLRSRFRSDSNVEAEWLKVVATGSSCSSCSSSS